MLAPYVAAYADHAGGKSIDWYTRTYYMGYVGYFLTTFLGGAATVKLFSVHAGFSYAEASTDRLYRGGVRRASALPILTETEMC